MSAARVVPLLKPTDSIEYQVAMLRRAINEEAAARDALSKNLEAAIQAVAGTSLGNLRGFGAMQSLTVLYSSRACWICNGYGWCKHREPRVEYAEMERMLLIQERSEP